MVVYLDLQMFIIEVIDFALIKLVALQWLGMGDIDP
jgi:hypothetical protein